MAKPLFSIVIVNFNAGDFLKGAVSSLARQTCRDFEVFIVDNNSTDTSMKDLQLELVEGLQDIKVEVMLESENRGFAKGNNLAVKRASGEWGSFLILMLKQILIG
jgi:GT2 family glycosyltransferase